MAMVATLTWRSRSHCRYSNPWKYYANIHESFITGHVSRDGLVMIIHWMIIIRPEPRGQKRTIVIAIHLVDHPFGARPWTGCLSTNFPI